MPKRAPILFAVALPALVVFIALLSLLTTRELFAQSAAGLSQVKKLYVAPVSGGSGATELPNRFSGGNVADDLAGNLTKQLIAAQGEEIAWAVNRKQRSFGPCDPSRSRRHASRATVPQVV
jgi:hypothetical protein